MKGEPRLYVVGHNTRSAYRRADGRISASAFVEQYGATYGLDRLALYGAIDEGWLPGEKVKGAGLDPEGHLYLIDATQLLAALETLPRCLYETCTVPAFRPSGACGRHTGPLAKRGLWWGTDAGQAFATLLRDAKTRDEVLRGRCWICGREAVPKAPAHVARAWREKRRRVCETCFPIWTGALGHVHAVLTWGGADSSRGVSGNADAVKKALVVARGYEREIHENWPAKPGLRLELAVVLVIEALHELGFSDPVKDRLLNVGHRYSERRRQRSGIRRRAAA